MDFLGPVIVVIVGLFLIFTGFQIWKKQNIRLLHDFQYSNVKKEDLPRFTAALGKDIILIGLVLVICSAIMYFGSEQWASTAVTVVMLAGIAVFVVFYALIELKYNRRGRGSAARPAQTQSSGEDVFYPLLDDTEDSK